MSSPLSNKLKPIWLLLNKTELSSHTAKYKFEYAGYKETKLMIGSEILDISVGT